MTRRTRFSMLALLFALATAGTANASGPPGCPADTNNDSVIDVQDLVNVVLAWGSGNPDADVTNDGIVNVEDLVLVIVNWGPCAVPEACDAGAGTCFAPNGTPGCNDPACCAAVCAIDPFCCDIEWDGLCSDEAAVECAGCGTSGAGNCYEANGTPGCSVEDCCQAVCELDTFCCSVEWDSICAGAAAAECGDCGGAAAGSCFAANGTPGCIDPECCESVCAVDPFCCNVEWDGLCVNEAFVECAGCGASGAGNCYASNGTPGCSNEDCCVTVCNLDPFCCTTEWDSLCASEAATECGNCGDGSAGSCFQPNGTPGCSDADCCASICAADPFCCNSEWDGLCSNAAAIVCGDCGASGAGSCYQDNDTPGCDDQECCQAVCALDPFCCATQWDGICAGEAAVECAGCGEPGAGDCFQSNGTPACNDEDCCQTVCELDPFCCEVNWDGICADLANDNC